MMNGVSEVWEEIGGGAARLGGGGFVTPWRFEGLSENNVADSFLTRALQRELCSKNYENEMSFAASSLRPEWKCKAENKLCFEADREMNLSKCNVSDMMNCSKEEDRGMNLLNLNKAERGEKSFLSRGDESLIGKGKNNNSLSVNGKVCKRKSRAANKTPITFLNADPANFRAMVQQVTGVPLNPNATRLWPPSGGAAPVLLKPEPKRPSSSSSAASIIQGLPTLDTSALFIHSAARQNSASASATELRSFAPPAAVENEIFLTEKLRAACMQSLAKNNGGGADYETDSWLNVNSFEGILSGSNGGGAASGSLPM